MYCPCCASLIHRRGRAVDRIPAECPPGDARIDPYSVNCNAHLVFRAVSCAAVEADCPSCSAAGYLIQASTQGAWGWLRNRCGAAGCGVGVLRVGR